MVEQGTTSDQTSADHLIANWSLFLPWLMFRQCWQLRQLSGHATATLGLAIVERLRSWPFDAGHPHGGPSGLLLAEAVHDMIRFGATQALEVTCAELRHRGAAGVPWMLRSRELAMYAAGHSDTTASLEAVLAMAAHAYATVDRHRGFTLLHEAAFCRKPWNLRALLALRCDARAQSLTGETALHVACSGVCAKTVEMVEQLLAHDVGLSALADDSGLLPVERAKHAQRRWQRTYKREPTNEEEHLMTRIRELLTLPCVSIDEGVVVGHELLPCCPRCGIRVGRRRTRDGRVFCAICGVLR